VAGELSSMQRVLTALGHQEADRVPFLLPVTIGGARELGMSIREFYSRPENVVEAQMRKRYRYRDDMVCSLFYGAIDVEAWGGEVLFFDDGPPNSGEPFIKSPEDIAGLEPPRVADCACLRKVLEATRMLKKAVGDEVPIAGVAISPFSLPVMQMGFGPYIELIYERPEIFERLIQLNEAFCTEWANAQLDAGATFIVYFDPVSSSTIITRELFLKTGLKVIERMIARLSGPIGIHMASGHCLPIIDDLTGCGAAAVAVSVEEDLAEIKRACRGRLAVLGNLNAIEMRHWTPLEAEEKVKEAIARAGPGGGYVLTDNHGEIPWQVPEEVLDSIAAAVYRWGRYPLDWVEEDAR
jgi:uroporphyrinogen decarboxylase